MTEEQADKEFKAGWGAFIDEADQLELATPSIPPTTQTARTFSDRIAFLMLEGYLPVLMLAATLLSFATGRASATVWLSSLSLAPFLVALMQPVLRNPQGVKPVAVVLVWPILALISSITSASTQILEHRVLTGKFHFELVAVVWQRSLEGLLSPFAVMLQSLVVILLIWLLARTHNSFGCRSLQKC